MHKCEYCGREYRNRYDWNVIITDDNIYETCSKECCKNMKIYLKQEE